MTSAREEHRVDFLGYGPDSPTSVFVACEEYCPVRAMEVCHDLHRRFPARYSKNEAVEAYARACKNANLLPEANRFEAALRPGDVPTWTFAAKLLHALDGRLTWEEEYGRLGTASGTSFLCEQFPVARPSRHHRIPNESELRRRHLEIIQRELVGALPRGALIVSYFNPAFLVGRMMKVGQRAWTPIAKGVWTAVTKRFVVLRTPFPRKSDDYPWLPEAVSAVKREAARLAQQS